MKQIILCELVQFPIPREECHGQRRASVRLLSDHPKHAGSKEEYFITSQVQSIDYRAGVIVTKNSIYVFEAEQE